VIDYSDDFRESAEDAREFERMGLDLVAVAEAYSFDAVSRLGYLAALTERITLASSILPVYSRTPALIAMTAAGLDSLSGGRFELGLGSSGPQVIEGFHGVPFTAPLGHLRETTEICRAVWRRERLDYSGRYYSAPLTDGRGTGLGKPLKLINQPVRSSIPIDIAALTPRAVAQAAEIANGWIPLFFYPERARDAWGDALEAGLEARDPSLGPLDLIAGAPLYVGDAPDHALAAYRRRLALYVGGMGARGANFYNDLVARYGYAEEAAIIQDLYLSGRNAEAAEAVPEELVRATSLIGSESDVAERLDAFVEAGATTISLQPEGRTRTERVESVRAVSSLLER
jgi:F420-dependent oxidoreductase-like protein